MPLSDKSIIKFNEAVSSVLEYTPKVFTGDMTKEAKEYLERRKERDFDFRLSDEVSSQIRVADAERLQQEEMVEQRTLEKLKEVEEAAYKEAYAIGLEEGKEKAFQEYSNHILEQLLQLGEVSKSLKTLKSDLIKFNEAHFMKTLLHLASRLAMREIETDQNVILEVVRQAVNQAQTEEDIRVQVSPSELEFLRFLQTENSRDLEFLKTIDFEENERVKPGGCIVETNYGVVDATIEARVEKLWSTLVPAIPKSKDTAE